MTARDYDDEARTMMKVAKNIRRDMFKHQNYVFSGEFEEGCQKAFIPTSLLSMILIILNGSDLKDQNKFESQACLTVCQIIQLNAKKRGNDAQIGHTRQTYPPPLQIYIGLKVHAHFRDKKLIQALFKLGISISFARVLEIESSMFVSVSERFMEDGVVCPVQLRKQIFTVAALDNIDHNLLSTSAAASFHDTGISLFQRISVQILVKLENQ